MGMHRLHSIRALGPIVALVLALSACVDDAQEPTTLAVAVDDTAVSGSFTHDGLAIGFRSRTIDPQRVELHLDLGDVPFDATLDLAAQRFVEDGHTRSLYEPERAALLALRDALAATHPELMGSLHGALLIGEIDRLAEAPIGLTLDRHEVDLAARPAASLVAGCGDDGTTCLPGTSGSTYAVYDPGAAGTCVWQSTSYGGSSCAGRCGAGCNWLDNDYMWDCLDHDRCLDAYGGSVLSGNTDCGDEFWDAADDYAVTLGPYCWSGSLRGSPPPPPPPSLTTIAVAPAPIAIDRGQRVQLRAIGTYPDGSTVDVTATASWTSSNPAVATVAAGRVDGQATSGAATITATVGTTAGTVAATVTATACHVTINELQAGGATSADEWIELYNGCTAAIDVTGWTLVYRAATTVGATDSMALVTLAGTMAPGELRMYASASAPAATVALATGVFAMGGANGQLQRTSAAVGLRGGPITTGALIDAVGYGVVTAGHPFAEGGTAAPALDNGRSIYRAPFDGRDSGSSAIDFALGAVGAATPKARNP